MGKTPDLAVSSQVLGETSQEASGSCVLPDGSLLLAHSTRIVSFNPSSGSVSNYAGRHHVGGFAEGHRTQQALFQKVSDLLWLDNVTYAVDCDNCRIRSIKDDVVSTFAGTGRQHIQDGPRESAAFFYPQSITHIQGTLYITDLGAGLIRLISPEGIVSTLKNTPSESSWHWKIPSSSLSSSHSSHGSSSSHSALSSSQNSSLQGNTSLSSSQNLASKPEFEVEKDGRLTFGILRFIRASQHSRESSPRVLYVADEIKAVEGAGNAASVGGSSSSSLGASSGGSAPSSHSGPVTSVFRLMKFDLESRTVEMVMATKQKVPDSAHMAPGEKKWPLASYHVNGGRDLVKEGPALVSGACVVGVSTNNQEECLILSDLSKHVLWRVHIKPSGHASFAVMIGKETEGAGAGLASSGKSPSIPPSKDGSFKHARLRAPSSPIVSPDSGDLYWLDASSGAGEDTADAPVARLRFVLSFHSTIQLLFRSHDSSSSSSSSSLKHSTNSVSSTTSKSSRGSSVSGSQHLPSSSRKPSSSPSPNGDLPTSTSTPASSLAVNNNNNINSKSQSIPVSSSSQPHRASTSLPNNVNSHIQARAEAHEEEKEKLKEKPLEPSHAPLEVSHPIVPSASDPSMTTTAAKATGSSSPSLWKAHKPHENSTDSSGSSSSATPASTAHNVNNVVNTSSTPPIPPQVTTQSAAQANSKDSLPSPSSATTSTSTAPHSAPTTTWNSSNTTNITPRTWATTSAGAGGTSPIQQQLLATPRSRTGEANTSPSPSNGVNSQQAPDSTPPTSGMTASTATLGSESSSAAPSISSVVISPLPIQATEPNFKIATSMPASERLEAPWTVSVESGIPSSPASPALYNDWVVIPSAATSQGESESAKKKEAM